MAVPIKKETTVETSLLLHLEEYPSLFNMNTPQYSIQRLKKIRSNLCQELEEGNTNEEVAQSLNLLIWIQYKLDYDRAGLLQVIDSSKETLTKLTRLGMSDNLCGLVNHAYLLMLLGETDMFQEVLNKLSAMRSSDAFHILKKEAIANQAYAYFRLGGPTNLSNAISYYEEAITQWPSWPAVYLFKFQLGEVFRRASHRNMIPKISGGHTRDSCLQRMKTLLLDVAENCSKFILKGRAYAGLATNTSFVSRNEQQTLRRRALEYAHRSNDTFLLATLGKSLPVYEIDKRIAIFEKIVSIRETSTSVHQLANGLKMKVESQNKSRNQSFHVRMQDEATTPRILSLYQKAAYLDRHNLPAVYDFAVFLKSCGKIENALEQFNMVASFKVGTIDTDYALLVSNAYLQAAKCLFNLSKETQDKDVSTMYEHDARQKLVMALSIAAHAAANHPDIKKLATQVWSNINDNLKGSRHRSRQPEVRDKTLSFIVEVMQECAGSSVDIISSFIEEDLSERFLASQLQKHLDANNLDEALLFLNITQTRPSVIYGNFLHRDPLKSLSLKVQLTAAHQRMLAGRPDARLVLRSLFTQVHGSTCQDVLIVHDDTNAKVIPGQRSSAQFGRDLQLTLNTQCDLDVSKNLQSCEEYVSSSNSLLKEMERFAVTLLLIGEETMGQEFKGFLETIRLERGSRYRGTSVMVLTTGPNAQVPPPVSGCPRMCIGDLPRPGVARVPQGAADALQADVRGAMELFCVLIGATWSVGLVS